MLDTTTFTALLETVGRQHGDRVFLHADSATRGTLELTYAELQRRSARMAAGLLQLGLRRGDRIAIAAPNQSEWIELFFAAVRVGIIVVTLNPRYRESELEYMINQSGARLVVSSARTRDFDFEAFYAGFRRQLPAVERVLFIGASRPEEDFEQLRADAGDADLAAHEQAVRPLDPAVILYTSGTTGRPKGAVLTHQSMLASARGQVANYPGLGADDVYLGIMPLNHVGGITCTITSAMLTGAKVVLQQAFSPSGALAAVSAHGVTLFAGVPTMWTLMLADPLLQSVSRDRLRYIVIGGSNLEPTLARRVADAFPRAALTNLYGQSEASGATIISPVTDGLDAVSCSIGVPLQGVRARVVGVDGAVRPAGEEGELQLQGDCVAAGYWNMPQQTAETFLADGWLATGDMVRQEVDGHVILLGRKKEMFLQGGYNVYPVEVENILTSHPAVAIAAGIGVPDPVLGEVGCYYVSLKAGQSVTADALVDFCRHKLADYKVPRQIVFSDQLPMTPAGKIAKSVLREHHPRP